MTANPYEPPKTAVIDVPDIVPSRPRSVSIALGLLLGAVVLQVLTSVYVLQEVGFHFEQPLQWIARGFDLLLVGFLCYHIARRRNWARLVLLGVTLFVFAQFCYRLGGAWHLLLEEEYRSALPRFLCMQVMPIAMSLIALHLLFFSGAAWFRRPNVV